MGNVFRRENVTGESARHGILGCFPNCNWDGDRRLGHSARAVRK